MSLLDQVRDVIRKKHYSIRTEQAYIEWIKRFASFHQRYPKYLTEKEIKGKKGDLPSLAAYGDTILGNCLLFMENGEALINSNN